MSWHTSGLIVHVATAEAGYAAFLQALDVGDPVFDRTSSFDAAVADGGTAIASVGGWTSVWGELLIVSEDTMKRLTRTADAFVFTLDGTSDSYLFEWWSKGTRKRKWLSQDGEELIDEGKPLPGEKAIFKAEADEEQRVFALMAKLTLPAARLMEPTYHVYRVDE